VAKSRRDLGEAKLPAYKTPPSDRFGESSTPFGGKQIAENPNTPTAAAIANAIADACGVRLFDLPLTAEKIYWALRQKR
jgi:CO/xanthine dehydrogenase Mo-binding subunit